MNWQAVLVAIASAALFGAATPASKLLLASAEPSLLAGLLYLGAGLGAALLRRSLRAARSATEAPLASGDVPWLAAAIVAGDIVGPLLLMIGLDRTDAAAGSLLLTLEGAATALLAWLAFRESLGRRIGLGIAAMIAGTLVLAWSGRPTLTGLAGPLAIVGACAAWGLDNNLTRKVALADPLQIVELKGLIAGSFNLLLGLWAGAKLPTPTTMLLAMLVGFVCYGLSLALFVRALRDLGSARTGAYFSTAPFIGAAASMLLLREPLTLQVVAAGCLMALGAGLLATETHEHEHEHVDLEHTHLHVHDAHHRHEHAPGDPPREPHAHRHRHSRLRHTHPHAPDMHHTHSHD